MTTDAVLTFEHSARDGYLVAEARLHSEATLNALSLDMIDLLTPALVRWAADERVVAVVLTGAGERAFSAGGDIQALYRAMEANHHAGERIEEYPYEFFEREYRLDYRLHTYPKPLIALGHGVIMGGGLGLFSAADLRVVTENVRIAFPEVTVGLFPDAGGTWFLRSLPEHQALFLGMTGSHLNSADTRLLGLGSHLLARADLNAVVPGLLELPLSPDPVETLGQVSRFLEGFAVPELAAAQLDKVPGSLSAAGSLAEVVSSVRSLAGRSSWIDKGIATMNSGCPTTVGIVLEQIRRAKTLSLADCFRLEMTVATHCADNHDFSEGVRALLIEKDLKPVWQFTDLESLPEAYVVSHFEAPWPRNPLFDLEENDMTRIGFIGLGNMGGHMARNLRTAGHELKVFDRVDALMSAVDGAVACTSVAEAATGVDVLITMLPAGAHVTEVYTGADGVLGAAGPETLLVDCSTIDPETARAVAAAAGSAGFAMLDAPVSGGTAGAEGGSLTFIVGGEDAALERARPLLDVMGGNVFHAGGNGAGQVAKVCNNMLLAIHMAGTAEALAMGVANGLDAAVLSEIMKRSSGGNWSLNVYNPYPGVMEGVPASRGYEGGFLVDLMTKDLGLAMKTAESVSQPVPLGALANNLYRLHRRQNDAGRLDFSSIQRLYSDEPES